MTLRSSVLALAGVLAAAGAAHAQVQIQPPRARVAPAVAPTRAIVRVPPGAELRITSSQSRFGPASRALIAREAARIAGGGDWTEASVRATVTQGGLGTLGSADIDALIQAIMLQAGRDAADYLRSQIDEMKTRNAQKATQRQNQASLRAAGAANRAALAQVYNLDDSKRASLDNLVDNMKNDLDSMSEMGEAESLRLQMAMDRLSKMMETLSNVLKKSSDTAQSITQNLK